MWPEPTTFEPGPGETVLFLSRGYETIIDEVDRSLVSDRKWTTFHDGKGKLYAKAWGSYLIKPRPVFYLHRLLVDCTDPDLVVDHRNGNGLDNRRQNLFVTCYSHNGHNREGTSHFRGVTPVNNRFRARISFKTEKFDLGYYRTAELAAIAYDQKAVELYGPYARTNFERPVDLAPEPEKEIPF